MRRDWDLIRDILVTCEDAAPGHLLQSGDFAEPDKARLVEHVMLLDQANFLQATRLLGSEEFVIQDFNWSGHDLLAQMRSDTWWAKTKKLAADKGVELTFAVIKELAPIALRSMIGG